MKNFKSEKGITLTALIVYVVVMVLVVSALSVMTSFFFTNISTLGSDDKYMQEYSKVNQLLVDEVNTNSNTLYKLGENQGIDEKTNLDKYTRISFYNKDKNEITTYQILDSNFYRNDLKICDDVKSGYFIVDDSNQGYINITLKLQLGENGEFTKEVVYTLKVQ